MRPPPIPPPAAPKKKKRRRKSLLLSMLGFVFGGIATGLLDPRNVSACASIDRVFRPDPDASALYQERHKEFIGLHKELKGVARRLHRITQAH